MKNVTRRRDAKGQSQQIAPRSRVKNIWLKAFIWVFLAIFIFGSVGVALVTSAAR